MAMEAPLSTEIARASVDTTQYFSGRVPEPAVIEKLVRKWRRRSSPLKHEFESKER
jgi:hypothetical protein